MPPYYRCLLTISATKLSDQWSRWYILKLRNLGLDVMLCKLPNPRIRVLPTATISFKRRTTMRDNEQHYNFEVSFAVTWYLCYCFLNHGWVDTFGFTGRSYNVQKTNKQTNNTQKTWKPCSKDILCGNQRVYSPKNGRVMQKTFSCQNVPNCLSLSHDIAC